MSGAGSPVAGGLASIVRATGHAAGSSSSQAINGGISSSDALPVRGKETLRSRALALHNTSEDMSFQADQLQTGSRHSKD